MKLHDIGIREVRTLADGPASAGAVLREIESLLHSLVEKDEGGSIDLRGLPLTEEDLAYMEEFLGQGEVYAEIDAMGLTQVQETGVTGVWWVTHHNTEEEVIGEFIEVTYCPEILMAPADDVKEAWQAMKGSLLAVNTGGE